MLTKATQRVKNFGLKWMPIGRQDMMNKGELRSCNYHTNSPFVVNVYAPTPENKNVYGARRQKFQPYRYVTNF